MITDNVLPDQGQLRQRLTDYVGELPFLTYCSDRLAIELAETFDYTSGEEEKGLVELEGYADPKNVAEGLLNGFEALPYNYSVAVQLPTGIAENFRILDRGYQISEEIALRIPNDLFLNEYPINSSLPKRQARIHTAQSLFIDPNAPKEWAQNACFFNFQSRRLC